MHMSQLGLLNTNATKFCFDKHHILLPLAYINLNNRIVFINVPHWQGKRTVFLLWLFIWYEVPRLTEHSTKIYIRYNVSCDSLATVYETHHGCGVSCLHQTLQAAGHPAGNRLDRGLDKENQDTYILTFSPSFTLPAISFTILWKRANSEAYYML